jgi:gliding motility-associated lipoprotein GldH
LQYKFLVPGFGTLQNNNQNNMKSSKLLLYIILFSILTVSSISCDKGPVFEKYLKLKNSTWDRFDIKQFDILLNEPNKSYDITLVVRSNEQFKSDKLPVYVILTSPKGEESISEVSIPVRENGKLITEPKGTKPESRLVLWKSIHIAANSNCKISIENLIPVIQTEGIEEIGIVLTNAK